MKVILALWLMGFRSHMPAYFDYSYVSQAVHSKQLYDILAQKVCISYIGIPLIHVCHIDLLAEAKIGTLTSSYYAMIRYWML